MRFVFVIYTIGMLLTKLSFSYAQGFVNLNFENATIVPSGSPHIVIASKALPGWTNGFSSSETIFYDTVSIGAAAISIHDTNDIGSPPIAGRYSVLLQTSFDQKTVVGIGQTGQIPSNSQSLRFFGLVSLQITFNGQIIPYTVIGDAGFNPSYGELQLYGADVSAYAGQTGELRFTGGGIFDNITFSTESIPEPSGLALFGVGASLLGFFRRRNSSR